MADKEPQGQSDRDPADEVPKAAAPAPKQYPVEAGVRVIPGGARAAITTPDGKLKELGTFKTYEEARAAYIKAQRDMYPIKTTTPPSSNAEVVELKAAGLTAKEPSGGMNRRGGR